MKRIFVLPFFLVGFLSGCSYISSDAETLSESFRETQYSNREIVIGDETLAQKIGRRAGAATAMREYEHVWWTGGEILTDEGERTSTKAEPVEVRTSSQEKPHKNMGNASGRDRSIYSRKNKTGK